MPPCTGSPGSSVASTVDPRTDPVARSTRPSAMSSLAGGAGRRMRSSLDPPETSEAMRMRYVVPATASNVTRPPFRQRRPSDPTSSRAPRLEPVYTERSVSTSEPQLSATTVSDRAAVQAYQTVADPCPSSGSLVASDESLRPTAGNLGCTTSASSKASLDGGAAGRSSSRNRPSPSNCPAIAML
jgi:hypothetical protein